MNKSDKTNEGYKMKTKQAIKNYAYGLAESFFYFDDETPWEPFENYEEKWLQENVDDLGRAIERAMLWAQEREDENHE